MKTKSNTVSKTSALICGAAVAAISAHASADYAPAIWRPACASHQYTGYTARQVYVIDDMEGYYASTISYLQGCNNTVSVHYCVNGIQDTGTDMPAGEITQMVLDANSAWTSGCWNRYAEQTEHEGFASNPAWYTEAMYQSSGGLTRAKSDKYSIPKDRNHIIGHNQKTVPGWSAWAAANLSFNANCNTHTHPGAYWDWNHYMAIIGAPSGSPRLDTFVRGAGNNLFWQYFNGAWSGWIPLGGGNMASDPSAVSWGPDRIDVFYTGTDNAVWHKWYSGGAWGGPESLGGAAVGSPDACSWGSNHLDVYARGTDNGLWHRGWSGTSWNAWAEIPGTAGQLTSDPSVVCWGLYRVDAFYRRPDAALGHAWVDGNVNWTWQGPESLGGGLVGGPDACSWGPWHLDVYARGTDNGLWHTGFSGGWNPWAEIPGTAGQLTSDPSVVCWGIYRVDAFYRRTDGAMGHNFVDGNFSWTWQGPESLGGGLIGGPDAASWSLQRQ